MKDRMWREEDEEALSLSLSLSLFFSLALSLSLFGVAVAARGKIIEFMGGFRVATCYFVNQGWRH
jgi:hypothetical protein